MLGRLEQTWGHSSTPRTVPQTKLEEPDPSFELGECHVVSVHSAVCKEGYQRAVFQPDDDIVSDSDFVDSFMNQDL